MARRAGLQAEVVASLALIMLGSVGVLGLVLSSFDEARFHTLLTRSLQTEAKTLGSWVAPVFPGTTWWKLAEDGSVRGFGDAPGRLDPASRAIAARARRDAVAILQVGRGETPLYFAVPVSGGEIAVALIPAAATRSMRAVPQEIIAGILIADAAIFTVFGTYLLRRRVVLPLRRLVGAARHLALGEGSARVPEVGSREATDVARAFNEMAESLEARTGALIKSVSDLEHANADLRRARAGLDRSERLASVGSLAAGVAHEVGNPMGALLAFLDLAGRDPSLSGEAQNHLQRAAGEGERVRRILQQLLDFSRPPRPTAVPVDLLAIARETGELVRAQSRYRGIEISVMGTGAPDALADRSAVLQILLNLVMNACDAVKGIEGPTIRIVVEIAPDGAHVECRVSDNGPGIPLVLRERIFDPFFTTKPPGEGTGLGLANAGRVAEELNGSIEFREGSGGGACFVLRLPTA